MKVRLPSTLQPESSLQLSRAAYIILVLFAVVLLFLLGSRWHVSDPGLGRSLKEWHIFQLVKGAGSGLNWLPDLPVITIKSRLGAGDALVNGFSLLLTTATILPMILLAGILGLLIGLFTADWGTFLAGIFAIIVGALLLISPVIIWFVLFFQPATPGYVLTWFILGLPFIAAGWGANVLVIHGATVVITKNS